MPCRAECLLFCIPPALLASWQVTPGGGECRGGGWWNRGLALASEGPESRGGSWQWHWKTNPCPRGGLQRWEQKPSPKLPACQGWPLGSLGSPPSAGPHRRKKLPEKPDFASLAVGLSMPMSWKKNPSNTKHIGPILHKTFPGLPRAPGVPPPPLQLPPCSSSPAPPPS